MRTGRSQQLSWRTRAARVLVVLSLLSTFLVLLGGPAPVDAAPGQEQGSGRTVDDGIDPASGTAVIEGTVFDTGSTPLEDVQVQAFVPGALTASYSDITDSSGDYSITGVDAGDWIIRITPLPPPTTEYVEQYYDQAYATATATPVTVADGQTVTGIDGHLGSTCWGPGGPPPPLDPGCFVTSSATCFWGVPGTTYGEWTFWWDELSCGGDPDTVRWTTNHGDDVVGNGVTLTFPPGQWSDVQGCRPLQVVCDNSSFQTLGTAIEGTVYDLEANPVPNAFVQAYAPGSLSASAADVTDASGNYALSGLAGDEFLIRFTPDPATDYVDQWYDQAYSTTTATPVTPGPSTVTGIDAHLGETCSPEQTEGCYVVSDATCFTGVPGGFHGAWTFWWDELSCGDASAVNWTSSTGAERLGNGAFLVFPQGTSTVDACVPAGGSAYCDTVTFDVAPPSATGYLRVTTNPAVPASIYVDGVVRNGWGLDWVSMPVGDHLVCFRDVAGFETPGCEVATVPEGGTATVQGDYTPLGQLKVEVAPAGLPSTIFVDGSPVNDFGS